MIRKPKVTPNEHTHLADSSIHRINTSIKMSTTTTTTLKSPNATLAPSFNNSGYSGGFGRIKVGTPTGAAAIMSTLTADLCKAERTNQSSQPPMGAAAVVVNSIIYSKPSFCSIVVDIGGKEAAPASNATVSSVNGLEENKSMLSPPSHITGNNKDLYSPPTTDTQNDGHVYMMSTTMNGAIHHQISEICDNLIAMGLFGMVANSEHDEDSLIEFSYEDADDGDDIEFLHTDEDYKGNELYNDDDEEADEGDEDDDDDDDYDSDDDNDNIVEYETNEDDARLYEYDGEDVTDFSRCPMITRDFPLLNCDSTKKKKKVRFNLHPTVHVLHAWDYAYRSARKGEWEMYARDRERFKLRIQRTAPTLNPILDREHRLKVYEQRFSSLYADQEDYAAAQVTAPAPPPPQPNKINQKQNQHKKKKKRKRRRPNF